MAFQLTRLKTRFLATVLTLAPGGFSLSAEGAFQRNRARTLCGMALLGAGLSAGQWLGWMPWQPWEDDAAGLAPETELSPVARQGSPDWSFDLYAADDATLDVVVFDAWYQAPIATRVKEEMQREYPGIDSQAGWKDSGIRVPLRQLAFLPHSNDSQLLWLVLSTDFESFHAEKAVPRSDLQAGKALHSTLVWKFDNGQGEGARITVNVDYHYDAQAGEVRVAKALGDFRVYRGSQSVSDSFEAGPWVARRRLPAFTAQR